MESTTAAGCLSTKLRAVQAAFPEIHHVNKKVVSNLHIVLTCTTTTFWVTRVQYSSTILRFPRDELKKKKKQYVIRLLNLDCTVCNISDLIS